MNLIVDTSVWSLVLRRTKIDHENQHVKIFKNCLQNGDNIHLLGNILQELLDGLSRETDQNRLLKTLTPFPLIKPERDDYIQAARLRNLCRKKGIQASPVDFLISATCAKRGYPLLTSDQDFFRIAKHCDLHLF